MHLLDLPCELLCDGVLDAVEDVERCAAACRSLRDLVRAHLDARQVDVRVGDDVAHALARARPGVRVVFAHGVHLVTHVVEVRTRLRLTAAPPAAASAAQLGGRAILSSSRHTLLRLCAHVRVEGLTFCCSGRTIGHPSAVVHCDHGRTSLRACTITSGDRAATFRAAGYPAGGLRNVLAPPIAGVWAGVAACVELDDCTVFQCAGPALRLDRGVLRARRCTVEGSSRGANVVARSGVLELRACSVFGSDGDGIALWSDVHALLQGNLIYDNRGTGVACHSAHARILDNAFRGNQHGPFFLGCVPDVLRGNTSAGE